MANLAGEITIVSTSVGDVGQYAPAQSKRTNYTPGKSNPFAGEANIGVDIPVKTGIPAIDALGITYTRIINVGQSSINQCDQPTPIADGTVTTTITAPDGSLTGTHTVVKNQIVNFNLEKNVAGTQV